MKKSNRIKFKGSLKYYLRWPMLLSLMMILICVCMYAIDMKAGIFMTIGTVIYVAISVILYNFQRPMIVKDLVDFASEYGRVQKEVLKNLAIPYAIADSKGKIMWVNREFANEFGNGSRRTLNNKIISSILPGISEQVLELKEGSSNVEILLEERYYEVEIKKLLINDAFDKSAIIEIEEQYLLAFSIFDKTDVKQLMKENQDDKMVAGLIYIDNYEEALESIEEVRRSLLIALIDRKVNKYIADIGGVVKKTEKDKYFILLKQRYVNVLQSRKFEILDEVRSVNIGNEMAVTISIGLGIGGDSYIQNCDYSRTAIDLALGRGGDQAVLKNGEKVYYYGGKTKSVEKNTRVKARIKAHALRELVYTKGKVIIMGHKLGDADSLGSAIGIYRAMKTFDKETHIVINNVTSSLRVLYEKFNTEAGYEQDLFLTSEQALEILDDETVVIVVDVNRASYTECPELIEKSKATVILDHHRQSSDSIDNAVLSYIEPYASSACEMVSEILQYISDGVKLKPQEADALYSGIMIDTSNFTNNTGVRTFEAAAFLRKNGADVIRVKKMFRDGAAEYKAKAEAIRAVEVFEGMFAISESPTEGIESPTVVGAQAANELLNIRGVKASFVLTEYNNQIYISARTIDEINVQLVMERLGGGGHMNVAGAQLENCSMYDAKQILKETLKGMIEDGDI